MCGNIISALRQRYFISVFIFINDGDKIMSSSFNQVTLVGHVGDDPKVSRSEGKKPSAVMSLATNKSYKVDGEKRSETHWHHLVAFNGLTEVVEKYVNKGSKILITGELVYNHWTDKFEQERQSAQVIVRDLKLLDKKDES
tara:strand:+ start:19393 stop:19815 length:423 start_codon:yes stop_codon:yes gene_type:complete